MELLPFLRWLSAHTAPRVAALVDDGRGLHAPALQMALPATATFHRLSLDDAAPDFFDIAGSDGLDLVQLAADPQPGIVAALTARLAPSGLLLTGPLGEPGGIAIPVADGITLLPSASPPPVYDWLASRTEAEVAELAEMFDALGRQIASVAALDGRAAEATRRHRHHDRTSELLAEAAVVAQREAEALRVELAQAAAERDAIVHSTSWRLTWPLRRALLAGKQRLAKTPELDEAVDERALFRKEAAESLRDFLLSAERLALPASATPEISILLVLYNQAPLTFLCLQSIVETLPPGAAVEVVIVDNASSDETALLLDRASGAVVIRNADNRHFLHGVNQAAAAAKGRDLLLLNNDARLRPDAVMAAHRTLHSAPDIGAVGGKIILLDGTLQEAGSIVWQDGTCVGYGRGGAPTDAPYQFRRDVDFCSGAFLLLPAALFHELGGLDTAFAPAYYEEVDLCMRLRAAGRRIVYDPAVVIDHFEFGSAASSDQAIALQARNHALFASRHAAALARHLPPGSLAVVARMDRGKRRLLYIDDRVPYPELGAGYPRAARLLRELVADGWFVTYYPLHDPADDWQDVYAAFPREVEFMVHYGQPALANFLRERDGYYDTVLVSRPHNMANYLKLRGDTQAAARLIYDAEAMFAAREVLRMAQAGRPAEAAQRRALLEREIALTETASIVTAVNEREADIFRGGGHPDVRVLGLGIEPQPVPAGFSGRRGFLFVGTIDEDQSPNVDALEHFVTTIMPLLSARLGFTAELTVAGRCRSPRAQRLAGEHVRLLGIVDDLTPLYGSARVFVAPHRYAAGLPLKVQEAVARGLPVVASTLLARQLGWTDGAELLAEATAEGFAAACARLHEDAALWRALRRGGLDRLTAETRANDFSATVLSIFGPG